ncbi:MAG: penicillin-binding transpeptidase domain-containing protein [Bacteroidales bacterium]
MRLPLAWLAALAAAVIALPAAAQDARVVERPDFAHYFSDSGTDGTMVVHDLGKDVWFVTNPARAASGALPASTFKIFNALTALSVGAARDPETELFESDAGASLVDGKPLLPPACTGWINLRTAFANSCIPVYQTLARRVGAERFRTLLAQTGYGNGRIDSVAVDQFWLEGDFRVTAWDQVRFLDRLVRDDLPFTPAAMAQVRAIMASPAANGAVIHAKTGYATAAQPRIGWWVGWVERNGRVVEFALNLDVTAPDHLKARQAIAKAILAELGAL